MYVCMWVQRHAVGGEYGAGWKSVGKGRLVTTFFPDDGSSPTFCDDRVLVREEKRRPDLTSPGIHS